MLAQYLLTVMLSAVQAVDPQTPKPSIGGSSVGLSLLEASGAANGTIIAAGMFCGEVALALLDHDGKGAAVLTILHGPTPFAVGRLHYHGGWDTSPVLAAVGTGSSSTLAVLHKSGLLQWAKISEDCSTVNMVSSHVVEGGVAVSAAANGDATVLVATTTGIVEVSPGGGATTLELDGDAKCSGTWLAMDAYANRLLLVCQPDTTNDIAPDTDVATQHVELNLFVRPAGSDSWSSSAASLNGTRTWTMPSASKVLEARLFDAYGDRGITAALISADSTVSLFDAWSGNSDLPTVGATGQPWSPDRQLDPGRVWAGVTTSQFLMTSYPVAGEDPEGKGKVPQPAPDMQLIGLRVADVAQSGSNEFVISVLVFGRADHLEQRQASLRDWKGQRQFSLMEHTMTLPIDGAQVQGYLTSTNADCFSFSVCDRGAGDNTSTAFVQFVRFLNLTRNFTVRGRQLRVALVLDPPTEATEGSGCGPPGDSPLTSWNDTALFDDTYYYTPQGYAMWGELVGRLASIYPHLVSLDIDDMSHDISSPWLTFTAPVVANITANMRRRAPWLTLAPTIYYSQSIPSFERWPDLPLALDSPIFFFRNQREGAGPCASPACSNWWGPKAKRLPNGTVDCPKCGCLAWTCAEPTVYNAPGETAEIAAGLPEGRDMLFGFYATGHSSLGEPSPRYVKELLPIAWGLPRVQGTSIWTMHVPKNGSCLASEDNLWNGDKGCIIREFYGSI